MRLSSIHVSNFMKVGNFAADLVPFSYVGAANGDGKSSIADAIRFAFLKDPGRAKNMKNAHMLVHRGSAGGKVSLVTEDGAIIERDVATGKALGEIGHLPTGLEACLNAGQFAKMSLVDRRNFLYDLMKLSSGPEEIIKRLLASGNDPALVDRLKNLLAGGFAPALAEADKRRLEGKGAWHEVTGETWGSKKAPTWVAQAPEFDAEELAEVQQEVADWAAHVEKLVRLDQQLKEWQKGQDQLPALREQGKRHAEHTTAYNRHKKEYDRLKEALEALPESGKPAPAPAQRDLIGGGAAAQSRAVAAGAPLVCPCCQADLHMVGGKLLPWKEPQPLQSASKKSTSKEEQPSAADLETRRADELALKARREQMRTDMSEAARLVAASEAAVREVDRALTLADAIEKRQISDVAKTAPEKLEEARRDLAKSRQDEAALLEAKRQADEAKTKTDRAAEIHGKIMKWDNLCAALSPEGIPAEILRDALGPLQAQLQDAAEQTGFPLVEVGSDMSITCGGFTYELLSRSFQWRCDAMLTVAFAILSGVKLALLDDLDTIVGQDRGQAMGWLYSLTVEGVLDQVLCFCALKDRAALPKLPDGGMTFWVESAK